MNRRILNTEIQNFINSNLNSDISSILLKGTSIEGVETKALIEQIEAKKKCHKKLPTWFLTNGIYFSNKLNIEQTSSEATAQYKSLLISGKSIIDITGGFGVDCFYFSKQFEQVTHCEINDGLSEIVNYNNKQLGIDNIETINEDGIEFIKTSGKRYDWIYVDPSRRHDVKGKVFFLRDCLPNIPEHLDTLFKHSNNIMIKTSPLLDISVGIKELRHVKAIHVVSVNNEVKELLWLLESGYIDKISIHTINLKKDTDEHFSFMLDAEDSSEVKYSLPLTYLYEPNSAIMKSGAFNSVSKTLEVFKLHKHSHLYTNTQLIDFPGRIFRIENILPYNKKSIREFKAMKANISARNFSEDTTQLKKKLSIKDGGDLYLFFTTDINNDRIIISTSKIS